MAKIVRARAAVFTSFEEEPPAFQPDAMGYMVYQREKAPDTGRLHWQGYVEFKKQLRASRVKALLGSTVHWELRRGSQADAIAYCKKPDTAIGEAIEHGKPKQQGKRSDVEGVKRKLLRGERASRVVWDCTSYQAMRVCQILASGMALTHEYKAKQVFWLYGPTGSGKTRTAMEATPADDTWIAPNKGEWFDGYDGQKHAIIDELRAKNWPYELMLRLLDGYQLKVPIKGGFTIWKPEVVYITTCASPEATYAGQMEFQGSIDQLKRRLTRVENLEVKSLDVNRVTPGAPGYDRATSHN